jgi:hypothetical protein
LLIVKIFLPFFGKELFSCESANFFWHRFTIDKFLGMK